MEKDTEQIREEAKLKEAQIAEMKNKMNEISKSASSLEVESRDLNARLQEKLREVLVLSLHACTVYG